MSSTALTLANKTALVTGASRGIGRGIAMELARAGASVAINYAHSQKEAEEVVAEIAKLGNGARAVAIKADVTNVADIDRLFNEARAALCSPCSDSKEAKCCSAGNCKETGCCSGGDSNCCPGGNSNCCSDGSENGNTSESTATSADNKNSNNNHCKHKSASPCHLDIVVSNSGTESWGHVGDITEHEYDRVFALNTKAQFFVSQAAYRHLATGGRLVLMSSIAAGLMGVADHSLYSASKSAVNGLVKAFVPDFGKRRITVNAVAPGGVKSDMFASNAWHYVPGGSPDWSDEKIEALMSEHCPLGRCAEPKDIARVVAFLASEQAGWVNGQIITLSGGSGQ